MSYFGFPSNVKIRRKWETFCRRADNKFKNLSDPRICSLHFKYEDLRKGLSGKSSIIPGTVPTIFDPTKGPSKENLRTERLEKRTLRVQQSVAAFQADEHPVKKKPKICDKDITDVSASEALAKSVGCRNLPYCNHDYTDRVDKVDESHKNLMCQTDLTIGDFEAMAEELQTLKAKLNSKFKQEKTVKFYTGIPSLACFMLLLNTLLPYAENMKYWDKNKC